MNKLQVWVLVIVSITLVLCLIAISVLAEQIVELKALAERNSSVSMQNRDYLWDVTYEIQHEPLQGPNGNPYLNDDVLESRIDRLYEEIWGDRFTQFALTDAAEENYQECGYQAVKVGCPDSRIDQVHFELYEEYFDVDQDTTNPLFSRIDAMYKNDILFLMWRLDDIVQAICEIEPETYSFCAQ